MDESIGSRRIINVGPYQSSLLGDSMGDLNVSASRKFDQVFDSQSSYDRLNSQRQGPYDKQFTQTHGIKRSETDPQKIDKRFTSSQQPAQLQTIAKQGSPKRQYNEGLGSTVGYHSAHGTNKGSAQKQNTSQMGNSYRGNNLEPILSQSMKLEESVTAPNRPPQRIPGLTNFLCDEHYKRIGVFAKKEDVLFWFWKEYVSAVYRQRRDEKLKKNFNLSEAPTTMSPKKRGTSFKGKSLKNQENLFETQTNEKSILFQYKKYENLFEMDVIYTIQQDLDEEKKEFKQTQMNEQFKYEQRVKKSIKDKEEEGIRYMLELFYSDLKEYELILLKEKEGRDKAEKENKKPRGPQWHKQQSITDSLNPIDSIEDEKKEPKKPTMIANFKKEEEKLTSDIQKEQVFMLNLMYMAREVDLTNDPKQLSRMYREQKEKARMGVLWSKGDADAERLITKFFEPEFFLKRLMIAYHKKRKTMSQKNDSLLTFYFLISKRMKLLNMIDKPKSEVVRIVNEYEAYQKVLHRERTMMQEEDYLSQQIRAKALLLKQVFGDEKAQKLEKDRLKKDGTERVEELAKPKDKWKRGKRLLELQKKFPHDMVLQKMIKEEFKQNRVFKYPEEYDVFDDDEDYACKIRENKKIQEKDLGQGKVLREKFKQLDGQELYYERQKVKSQRTKERELEKFIIDSVTKYLEKKKHRLNGQRETVRQYLSKVYQDMVTQHPEMTKKRFPHLTYGMKEDSTSAKQSFPSTFKRYFFKLMRSFVKTDRGLKRLKLAPPTFIIPGGKRCTIHEFACPEDCEYATLNKKVILRSTLARKKQREPATFRSKVWRRKDYREAMKDVLMTNSEIANCTFEPEAGSLSKNIEQVLQANPNLRKEGYTNEPDPEAYFSKLGKNFESSHPEVYKLGVLKRAKLKYSQGKYEEAMNILCDGFNIDSIKKRFDPNFMKRFMAEALLKKKNERMQQEEEEKKRETGKIFLQKEQPDSQKKRPEEDFENKKLVPVLREAFELLQTIENIRNQAEKQIKKVKHSQKDLKTKMNNFSEYKRAQTKVDPSKQEKILFKSIMCPLKEKCPKSKVPRWPTSNTKSITKFGEECPYAHHPTELMFPESIITKMSANKQRIKNLEQKKMEEKPRDIFKPSGGLFDCRGCAGHCNLCKYKVMADAELKKFNNKSKKESLMRSIERRESVEIKRNNNEMSIIREKLDLDSNYTKKFGLLKKACVLKFYGRLNDAFDEIAKAAKIVQDQKEVEQQKQKIIEKRWKFKLGLDDNFDLPIPIEQIDPSKVDDKFLKKLDMPGVAVATIKLYIDQVCPQKNEEHSKHQFLNQCIEDFFLECEAAIEDKQHTIKMMKKQVEKLDEEADLAEVMNSSPDRSPEKGGFGGGSMRIKKKKTKMCPTLLEKGSCPLVRERDREKRCQFAHNPIELDLIPAETKMKNLTGVIQQQNMKMRNMKPIEPWKPAKSGEIEHTHLMDMTSKKKKKKDDDDDDEHEQRKEKLHKSIYERDNIFRKPYEKEE